MSKKVLILGASGLTGYKLFQLCLKRFDVYGTFLLRSNPVGDLIRLDLRDNEGLKKVLADLNPNIIVNATALHNVDYCESHPDEAFLINSKIVGSLANLCNHYGSRLVHISTDFVFDGRGPSTYDENYPPKPLSVYARSKLLGEKNACGAPSFCVIRTSVVYGWTPNETQGSASSSGKPMNFALWVLNKLANSEKIKVVVDQYSTPTLADVLAQVIVRLACQDKNGIYHVSGTSCVSRFDFARLLAKVMGYPSDQITPVRTVDLNQSAERPLRSCLDCKKVQKEFGFELPDLKQSLFIMRSQIDEQNHSLLGN